LKRATTTIDGLIKNGKVDRVVQKNLETTSAQVDAPLISTLRRHADPLVREACAAILGERRSRKALPALLKALDDESVHVRMDAVWAIEKVAGLTIGDLMTALLLDINDWPEVRRRVRAWWRVVKDDDIFKHG